MKNEKMTFAQLLESAAYRYEIRMVFDDFLIIALCAFSQNPLTGKSHDEDLYMQTIGKYKKEEVRKLFPQLLATLILEMEERADRLRNDVLGECFERNFCRKNAGQFFTPAPICELISSCLAGDVNPDSDRPLRILDPTCGSGRMLLAGANNFGREQEFYGIDIDHTCVMMTAINLFLNGIFHGEVMWSDALQPDDFRMSYRISFLPFGIFRIEDKEESRLWHLYKNSFSKPKVPVQDVHFPEGTGSSTQGSQLHLF